MLPSSPKECVSIGNKKRISFKSPLKYGANQRKSCCEPPTCKDLSVTVSPIAVKPIALFYNILFSLSSKKRKVSKEGTLITKGNKCTILDLRGRTVFEEYTKFCTPLKEGGEVQLGEWTVEVPPWFALCSAALQQTTNFALLGCQWNGWRRI